MDDPTSSLSEATEKQEESEQKEVVEEEEGEEEEKEKEQPTASAKRKSEWFEIDDDHNTYVYVSGLPTELTEEEFVDMMKKYGIIVKKALPGSPYNIKMYKNSDGTFKGDALCCFARKESVELALTHLDGYQCDATHVIRCERAKFQMKGSYDPSKKPRLMDKRSKIIQKKTVNKLLSWEPKAEVNQRKVILRHMFDPKEILEDATLILDLKEDVEAKCAEIGCEPKGVEVYDKHPEGAVIVTFQEPSHAQLCIGALDNQYYAGRLVKAELWNSNFKKSYKEIVAELESRQPDGSGAVVGSSSGDVNKS